MTSPATDLVARVFTPAVRQAWLKDKRKRKRMTDVLGMLLAQPIRPGDDFSASQLWRLAYREAVAAYLGAADAAGLLRGKDGRELLSRLRAGDVDNYRGGIAECIAAWWLSNGIRRSVVAHPPGRPKKVLDLGVKYRRAVIGVEVKAPYRKMRFRSGQVFMSPFGEDHMGAIMKCLVAAADQLRPGVPNVAVLVPSLDWPIRLAVLRCFQEEPQRLAPISCALVIDVINDAVNPNRGKPGIAFFAHRCYVVKNRHAALPLPDSLWRGWPVFEGDWWAHNLEPLSGRFKQRLRTPGVSFTEKVLVPVPLR